MRVPVSEMKVLAFGLFRSPSSYSAVRPRWTRFIVLVAATTISFFWFRDVFRLSSLGRESLAGDTGPATYGWGDTAPVIAPPRSDLTSAGNKVCDRWPKDILRTVQVVLKTGVAEDQARTRAWLRSLGKCIENILIFSDAAGNITGREVHDVLAVLPSTYREESNPDFGAYDDQRRLLRDGELKEPNTDAGWKLDRFKFLPMVYLARKMRPGAKWFVFVESDTYVSWDNLFRFLNQFNPEHALYIGAPLRGMADGSWFTYGGSGIVLSHAAVDQLLARGSTKDGSYREPEVFERQKWIDRLKNNTYGESTLGKALQEAGVSLSGFYPSIYPLNPSYIPFGDTSVNGFWCEPVISMHKLWTLAQYQELWQWEMDRDNRRPFLFGDLFDFVKPHTPALRNDWDNLSTGLSSNNSAHHSPDLCYQACVANVTCSQYMYHDHSCSMSSTVSLGGPRLPESKGGSTEDTRFVSGWLVDVVEEWKANPDSACENVRWLRPSVERRWGA